MLALIFCFSINQYIASESQCTTIWCNPMKSSDSRFFNPVIFASCDIGQSNATFNYNFTASYSSDKCWDVDNWCAYNYQPKKRFLIDTSRPTLSLENGTSRDLQRAMGIFAGIFFAAAVSVLFFIIFKIYHQTTTEFEQEADLERTRPVNFY
jgi:hypothetical protein